MDPSLRLKLAPMGRLAMTFSLGQALELLQMPQIELAEWLNRELEKNPLLRAEPRSMRVIDGEDLAAAPSLYEHLMKQIRESFPLDADHELAGVILEHLDEKGFLTTSLEEIVGLREESLRSARRVLEILQTFDPPGVFARNLQEALLLQLKARGMEQGSPFRLVRDCFDDLLQGRYASIKQAMGPIDLSSAIRTLAKLRMRPAEAYRGEATQFVSIDLSIQQTDTGWLIEMREEQLPKIEVCAEYQGLSPQSAEEKESLRTWQTGAKWLLRSLKRRRQILLRIATYLVRKQSPYLSGKGTLRSVTIQELASELNLHESTLSRALSGKYAETPRGVLLLRSLVTASPETGSAKSALAELVASEDKREPLNDDQLCAAMQKKGYAIARRTIAKYRKELGLSAAARRKYQ